MVKELWRKRNFKNNLQDDVCPVIWSYIEFPNSNLDDKHNLQDDVQPQEVSRKISTKVEIAQERVGRALSIQEEKKRWTVLWFKFDDEAISEALGQNFSSPKVKFKLEIHVLFFYYFSYDSYEYK